MGHEVSFLQTWTIEIWAIPMVMGFRIPHDRMVPHKRNKLTIGHKNNVTETK